MVESGIVSFEFSNQGGEVHELVLIRKNDDTTESFDELLELPEEEAQSKTTFVGGIEPTVPGEDGYVVADLDAGEYIALCFLPVGATPEVFAAVESGEAEPPEGPPHFTQGMRAEFTVE